MYNNFFWPGSGERSSLWTISWIMKPGMFFYCFLWIAWFGHFWMTLGKRRFIESVDVLETNWVLADNE
jgi:hypothetical protein